MDDECGPLPVHITEQNNRTLIVSCWKLSEEELAEVKETGVIWLGVCGAGQPPVWLQGTNPFVQE